MPRKPDLYKPRGRNEPVGTYEPPEPAPRPPSGVPRLSASDTSSCRKEIGRPAGQIKYCPKVPTHGNYCEEHKGENKKLPKK